MNLKIQLAVEMVITRESKNGSHASLDHAVPVGDYSTQKNVL